MKAKSQQDRQNALNQIATVQQQLQQSFTQLYRPKDVKFDVKCQAADKIRVRKFEPVQVIDPETGEFVKMTKELLEKARGKEGYPGYMADTKLLANGQLVTAYISKDSKTPANFMDLKSTKASMKEDDLRNELKNFRYDIIMVYVLADAPKKIKSPFFGAWANANDCHPRPRRIRRAVLFLSSLPRAAGSKHACPGSARSLP